jgi:hypothetical protein
MRVHLSFAIILISLLFTSPVHAKRAATIYTAEKVEIARENIANYDWAKQQRDATLAYADKWLAMSDEQIWNLPVEQTVPRSIYVHATQGCPIHGKALIDKYGVYGWKVDPINKPWKVQCPIGGETWPTNDFQKFYASGKDGKNVFQYSVANRSHLYSTDSSRNYGVDDGKGYVDGYGNRYNFIAYYAHWGVWQNIGRSWSQALANLGEAYVFTGNPAYAHKAAILLSRIADLLPTMDTSVWGSQGYSQGDGLSGMGLALGSIWDAALASSIARTYDAIYPALNKDPQLYTFLQGKASRYGLHPVDTPANFQKHIEQNALVVLLKAIQARRVRANEGIHQKAYAEAAIALDDPAQTPNWLEWLLQPGTPYQGGGHLPSILVDLVDRDGASDEGSPGYNMIWLEALQPLADLLEDSPYAESHSITKYPNFRNLLSFPFWMQLTPNYYPHIGDESLAGNPGVAPGTDPNRYAAAFQRYGFPELAQMAYQLNGNSSHGLHGGIFDPGAEKTAAAIDNVIATGGKLPETSAMHLNGYGLAAMRGQAADKPSAVWMYSGIMSKHGHSDRLNLGMFVYGLDFLPDLGYPDFPTVDSPNYWGWQNNTVAHNTVVVNAKRQTATPSGNSYAFVGNGPVQMVEVDGNGVYAETPIYRRALLRVPTTNGFYLVDLFRVQGGEDHLYSLHAAPGTVATNAELTWQNGGTYAGQGVGFGNFYDGPCCAVYKGSGFQFLNNVARDDSPPEKMTAEWFVRDHWGALPAPLDTRLKVWSVGDAASTVAFADGYPPSNKPGNPQSMRYMLERRFGSSPLTSTFVHVFDPHLGTPQVAGVERFTPTPATDASGFSRIGLRITLADGRVDTIVHAIEPADTTADGIRLDGRAAVIAQTGDKVQFAQLLAGTTVAVGDEPVVEAPANWSGSITAIDTSKPEDIVLVTDTAAPTGAWKDRYVKVFRPGGRDPFYRIVSVENIEGGARIHLGRVTLQRGHADTNDYSKGYVYDVAVGDRFLAESVGVWPPLPEDEEVVPPVEKAEPAKTTKAAKLKAKLGCASTPGSVPLEWGLLLASLLLWRYGAVARRRTTRASNLARSSRVMPKPHKKLVANPHTARRHTGGRR